MKSPDLQGSIIHPLLEYSDRERFTMRVGDQRVRGAPGLLVMLVKSSKKSAIFFMWLRQCPLSFEVVSGVLPRNVLDNAYGCMDHQAWALIQYIQEKTPDTARRFEGQRTDCLSHMKKIADFYSTLPPSPEVPAPLSTR